MFKPAICNFSFIIPTTTKFNPVTKKTGNVYNFYSQGEFFRYLENEDEHPVDAERNVTEYENFSKYLSEHQTKETKQVNIPIFTKDNVNRQKVAKDSIIHCGVISLSAGVSKYFGFKDKKSAKEACIYYFNAFIKSHKFNEKD
ncbi:MAG: hypothetical protein MJ223_02740 [Mycoplasmoidaceae bacterium]|nr:hypothetical protein [Mycoplasmoidaceae bacterium]